MQKPMNLGYASRLGRRLRMARRKSQLSARVLGEMIGERGVHRNTIYRWESGLSVPRADELYSLQRVLLEKGCRL